MLRRSARLAKALARWTVYLVALLLVVAVLVLVAIQTGWTKNQLRQFIVRQANQYLTATLEIGSLSGSLVRGIELGNVRLSRDGDVLVSIEAVHLAYSIRELFERGTIIREIQLTRPHFMVARESDGRWNLGALIKRNTQAPESARRGPGRPLHLMSIEIIDGSVDVRNELKFGAANVSTQFEDLDLALRFDYEPVEWTLSFIRASWVGKAPDLKMQQLTGRMSNGSDGWSFDNLRVETGSSRFTLNGRIDRSTSPSQLALKVDAERFLFQEWGGTIGGLKNIAIDAEFETRLNGPLALLATDLNLRSNGGNVQGSFVLDTTARGWRGNGAVDVERLRLERWLNRPDRPSDISGHVTFDLTDIGLRAGGRFPVGTYVFDGSHAEYLGYEADDLVARGRMTPKAVIIASATTTAYGANVSLTSGSIGLDSPYPYAFAGRINGIDLRQVPPDVPVPHVESTLTFDYDVRGQFTKPFIAGTAMFGDSVFLGADIAAGATGAIDTSVSPIRYSGEGDLRDVNLNEFGRGLDVGWLQEPRYAGSVDGHFTVTATGTATATMTLEAGGRLAHANLFGGQLSNAAITLQIDNGSLTGSYDGRIERVNPAIAMGDQRYDASLTGTGSARIAVRDLLVRSPSLADYTIDSTLALESSRVSTVAVDTATAQVALRDGTMRVDRLKMAGPAVELEASGRIELDGHRSSQLDYNVARGDLAFLSEALGRSISGDVVTAGQLTGQFDRLRAVGHGTFARLEATGVKALTADLKYDVTIPPDAPKNAAGTVDGRLTFVEAFGQELRSVSGTASYDAGRVTTDLTLDRADMSGVLTGTFRFHPDRQLIELLELTASVQRSSWRLVPSPASTVSWDDRGVSVQKLEFVDAATGSQRVTADGTWYPAGGGTLSVTATNVSLDALTTSTDAPSRYGGNADISAIVRGTREQPIVTGQINVRDGRVWRVAYESLRGRVDYENGAFLIDVRLDQSPGVWLTAVGRVPLGMIYRDRPEQPMDVAIKSSSINLGLLEGVTSVVHDVGGRLTLDVRAIGTTMDPHFDGRVDLSDATFTVTASGARYKNGRVNLQLTRDRVVVDTLHLEDGNGDPLDVRGSLATHELRVGDLAIDVNARGFEVLRNDYGRMDIDGQLQLRGQFESPRLEGRITVTRGDLNVDTILDRTMLQPYSVNPAGPPDIDAIAALNPWDRLGLGIELNVPNTLRMSGDNVQISPDTPLGLGNINLRALGDLYLYKDPGQPLYVTGSLDSVTGTYSFQGRRFELDAASSINFRGDINPELYVTVRREISGVETRVTILGPLNEPELRLASTPPLEQSDILSLIVFNTSVNQLTLEQQRDLIVRAGALAAGFLAAPVMTALERTLGLDTLEIEPGVDITGGTRVTIGQEIAPGLVARFSRQFGEFDYDEATIEYYLSRILRIRATFSDAGESRSQFRRTDRAGIDLLLFFSF